jgi:hypothetical protein
LNKKTWLKPIVTEEMKEKEDLKRNNLVTSGGQTGMGFGGIKRNIERNQIRD